MSLNLADPKALEILLSRRSVRARDMVAPAPDDAALEKILQAGMRVPDHGKLTPWRFLVFDGNARLALGEIIGEVFCDETPNATDAMIRKVMHFVEQAPLLIILISSPSDRKPIPLWEQQLSAGASAMSMLIAAHMQGYVGQWLTDWPTYSAGVGKALHLGKDEKIAGFLFFGSQSEAPKERDRPEPQNLVRYFKNRSDVRFD